MVFVHSTPKEKMSHIKGLIGLTSLASEITKDRHVQFRKAQNKSLPLPLQQGYNRLSKKKKPK